MSRATSPSTSSSTFLRFQKSLVSKMSSKKTAKLFIGETANRCLDNLNMLIVLHSGGSKKQADSIMNDMIKIIMKIGVLFVNNQLNDDEMNLLESVLDRLRSLARAVILFYEDKKSYNRSQFEELLKMCHTELCGLISGHLTDNSKARVDNVFNYFTNLSLMVDVFKHRKYDNVMQVLVTDLKKLVDQDLNPNTAPAINRSEIAPKKTTSSFNKYFQRNDKLEEFVISNPNYERTNQHEAKNSPKTSRLSNINKTMNQTDHLLDTLEEGITDSEKTEWWNSRKTVIILSVLIAMVLVVLSIIAILLVLKFVIKPSQVQTTTIQMSSSSKV